MKTTTPRNHVARAMRLAGKAAVAHGKSRKQERRREKVAVQRALKQGREVFQRVGVAGSPKSPSLQRSAMRRRNPSGTGAGRRAA